MGWNDGVPGFMRGLKSDCPRGSFAYEEWHLKQTSSSFTSPGSFGVRRRYAGATPAPPFTTCTRETPARRLEGSLDEGAGSLRTFWPWGQSEQPARRLSVPWPYGFSSCERMSDAR